MLSVGPREIETTVGGIVSADVMNESVAMPVAVTVTVIAGGSVGTGILIAKRKGNDGGIGKGSESGIGIGIGSGRGGVMDRSGIMTAMNDMPCSLPRDQTAQTVHQVETRVPKTLPI
jgi:hypothetical protein